MLHSLNMICFSVCHPLSPSLSESEDEFLVYTMRSSLLIIESPCPCLSITQVYSRKPRPFATKPITLPDSSTVPGPLSADPSLYLPIEQR